MYFRILLALWLFVAAPAALAQVQGTVGGMVTDTLRRQTVEGATISLLRSRDSSLVSFSMSGPDGRFRFNRLPLGRYELLVTHVNYHPTRVPVELTSEKPVQQLDWLPLGDKYKTLAPVHIQAEAPPVTVREDTVEYHAGAFKTPPQASVEDLLKKLPGVQVDKDGTVRAQGQKVNRVLVDGKEFFGKDPRMATRNLDAEAIDKVQVFDRMSEQAQLSGFDDGNSERTINLKLKKERKKGVFGRTSAGMGTADRFEGRFNLNKYAGARQLSLIGRINNINDEGFGFSDITNQGAEGGGSNVQIKRNEADNSSNNNGINTSGLAGLNYNDLIGTKLDLQSSYFYGYLAPHVVADLERQYLLPDSSYFFRQQEDSRSTHHSQRFQAVADYQIDSFHSFRYTPVFRYQDSRTATDSRYVTETPSGHVTNAGLNRFASGNRGYTLANDILFRKKFRKRGRTLSIALQQQRQSADGDGDQQSLNRFFDLNGQETYLDSIRQRFETASSMGAYTIRAVYTEPLLRRSQLEFTAAHSETSTLAQRSTWDFNPGTGDYDLLNPLLSNEFDNGYSYTNAGVRTRRQHRKFNWSAGASWQQAELQGQTLGSTMDTLLKKRFYNLLPQARLQYFFNRFSHLRLTYSTATRQPTVAQLQPLPDISNPLSIRVGNPDLKQEYAHQILLDFLRASPFRSQNFFVFLNFRHLTNRIVSYDSINSSGIKLTRPVNARGTWSLQGDINYGRPLPGWKQSMLSLSLEGGYSLDFQYINGVENRIEDGRLRPELRLEGSLNDRMQWGIFAATTFYRTGYSLQPDLSTSYFMSELGTSFMWEMPGRLFLNSELSYAINARRADGFNQNIPLWNAAVYKQFLKSRRLQAGIRVFDILNQQVGITRTSNANFIEDRKVNLLQRYLMLTFTYNLSKMSLNVPGGMR